MLLTDQWLLTKLIRLLFVLFCFFFTLLVLYVTFHRCLIFFYLKVLFPMLARLLEVSSDVDPVGLEETRMRAATLLCKVCKSWSQDSREDRRIGLRRCFKEYFKL